jgi:ferric-dicitrate binding protein FerR (iron transport regulator)
MAKTDINQIMDNYIGEKATPDEKARAHEFATFLEQQADLQSTLSELKSKYEHQLGIAPAQIRARRRGYIIASTAAASLFLAIIVFQWHNRPVRENFQGSDPLLFAGTNRAQLTLANGKVFDLDDSKTGLVYNEEGLSISNSHGGIVSFAGYRSSNNSPTNGLNELSIPKGGHYTLIFPDGTSVILNALSKLKFPLSSNSDTRTVYLNGEAFFKIAKDTQHPFKVISKNQSIEVLGTSFNVSNYSNEPEITTVATGKIRLTTHDTSKPQEIVVEKNQQVVYVSGKVILSTTPVDPNKATSWKDYQYILEQEPLSKALVKLGRWFDVEVDTTQIKVNKIVNASFSKSEPLTDVLSNISKITNVKLKLDGRKIVIK